MAQGLTSINVWKVQGGGGRRISWNKVCPVFNVNPVEGYSWISLPQHQQGDTESESLSLTVIEQIRTFDKVKLPYGLCK